MGARIRHLERAPITEALVDVRIEPSGTLAVETLAKASEAVVERYPKIRPIQQVHAELGLSGEGTLKWPDPRRMETGFLYFSEDEKTVVQFRLDGFTFNKLQPYSSWSEIRPEVWRLWAVYRDVVRPAQIARVGMRNINRVGLPSAEFGKYLCTLPTVPAELPQQTRSFLTRVVLYDDKRAVSVSLTQAFESPVEAPALSVLLDIDSFKECAATPSDDELGALLESLHELKNEVFFGSITEETARMYE